MVAQSPLGMPDAGGLEQPVDLGGADGQQLCPYGSGQRAVELFISFEPVRQRRLEEFAAQLVAQEPESLERRQQHGGLVAGFGAGPLC